MNQLSILSLLLILLAFTSAQIISVDPNCALFVGDFCFQCKEGFQIDEQSNCISTTPPTPTQPPSKCEEGDGQTCQGVDLTESDIKDLQQNLDSENQTTPAPPSIVSTNQFDDEPIFVAKANDQENDVAEPELLDSDGEYIYTFTNRVFSIFKSYPSSSSQLLSTYTLDQAAQGMFVSKNEVVLFGYVSRQNNIYETVINILSISDDRLVINLKQTIVQSGLYFGSRQTQDGYVYIITKGSISKPYFPAYYIPGIQSKIYTQKMTKYYDYKLSNAKFITVISFLPSAPQSIGLHAFITGPVESLYMSGKFLYIYYEAYSFNKYSAVHKITVNQLFMANSGDITIQGHINNQFSFDYDNGLLKIATSDIEGNLMYVINDASFQPIHRKFFGLGRRITAVRYINDRAYVATVQLNEPMYVIEFNGINPPVVVGQFDASAYSRYIYPLQRNILVTFGRAYNGTELKGLTISVVNVADPANPFIVSNSTLQDANIGTTAWFDPKGILLSKTKNTLVLPATLNTTTLKFNGALVYYIDSSDVTYKYFINHQPDVTPLPNLSYYYNVQRSIIIEQAVYTKSRCILGVNRLFDGKLIKALKVPPCK